MENLPPVRHKRLQSQIMTPGKRWGRNSAYVSLDPVAVIPEMPAMVPMERLAQIRGRYEFLEARLNEGAAVEDLPALSREYAELKPVVEQIVAYQRLLRDADDARRMLSDPEMKGLAEEEISRIGAALPEAEHALRLALIPGDAADARSAIIEIRAGTGGDEAALFAGDLARMYQRLAERRGWRWSLLEETPTELGGVKELVAEISGAGVFSQLKFESGVHRVQRVPVTESGGRIHTSAATVAVLPEAEEVDIDIPACDIRIDTMRASGAGGQHVNTTDSAVRISHIPTGIVVTSSEKSQHQNRARAMQVLRARLFDLERQRQESARAADRKGQVGSGDRSERIRTYNFPQGRLTDHRIGLTLYKLDQVMQGDLDEVIEALVTADQANRLAELES
jgi:peptide chain release factor 1